MSSGLAINDTPDYPITAQLIGDAGRVKAMPHGPARAKAWQELQAKYPPSVNRAYFGRESDQSVGLSLRDDKGRVRAVLSVKADGQPSLRFLNAEGGVTKEWSGER